jgi:hypothetical protein
MAIAIATVTVHHPKPNPQSLLPIGIVIATTTVTVHDSNLNPRHQQKLAKSNAPLLATGGQQNTLVCTN